MEFRTCLYSPYYYYASKSSKYERQNYRSNLSLSYRLSSRFRPFVRVAHLYHWSTGSVDPRMDDKRFDLKLQPGIIFYIKNSNLALSGIYGKGNERLSVDYKNRNYLQNLVFPDRIHYLSLGYGYNGIKDTSSMRKYNSYRGFELSYHQDWEGKMLDILSSYVDREERFTTDGRATSKNYNTRGIYNEAAIKFEASLNIVGRRSNDYLSFYSERVEGSDLLSDLSTNLSKSNYEVQAWTNRLTYMKETKKASKLKYQIALGLQHYFLNRQDHASGIDVSNHIIKTSLPLGLIVRRNYEEKWVINFNPNIQIPVSGKLTYSENALNNFIRDVIFWDYNYLNTSNYGADFSVEFISKRIVKDYNLGVFGGWKYQRGKVSGYLNRQQYEIGMRMYL
ncbi:DUF6850 family outer membrane beta-barrel protein [Sphingobacterium thalpophilum]|uniref:DUF6850 family outer membrane beta-barrel protein n=1 Tax=Sphingobacterium thalpophilum TaxID=259 RepID=UPI0031D564A2